MVLTPETKKPTVMDAPIAARGVNRQHVCRWKFGSWNVRQWGAVDVPYDPWTKTQCLFRMANKRGWHAIMLSDVNLGANGTKYVKVDGKEWVVVVRGKDGNWTGR